jgi:hypothetical protein
MAMQRATRAQVPVIIGVLSSASWPGRVVRGL